MAKKKSIDLGDILNDASFAAEKPETETGFSIQHIDLDHIRPSDKNKYGIRDIEELAAAIPAASEASDNALSSTVPTPLPR